jgi:hypothetical protein
LAQPLQQLHKGGALQQAVDSAPAAAEGILCVVVAAAAAAGAVHSEHELPPAPPAAAALALLLCWAADSLAALHCPAAAAPLPGFATAVAVPPSHVAAAPAVGFVRLVQAVLLVHLGLLRLLRQLLLLGAPSKAHPPDQQVDQGLLGQVAEPLDLDLTTKTRSRPQDFSQMHAGSESAEHWFDAKLRSYFCFEYSFATCQWQRNVENTFGKHLVVPYS